MMKKEEIIKRNTELEAAHATWVAKDKVLRENMSRVLGSPHKNGRFGDSDNVIYSWYEIFSEIGRLLSVRDSENLKEKYSKLDFDFMQLNDKYNQLLRESKQ